MSTVTQPTTNNAASPVRLAMLWFGIQLVWGAMLGLSLQARCLQLDAAAPLVAYGIVSTLGAVAAAIAQLVVGPFSDRLRRRGDKRIAFYAAGALAGTLALLAFYFAANVTLLGIAFVALQAGMNVAIGPYQSIVPDAVPPGRIGVASGWMAGMQSAGNAAGAIAATLLGNGPRLGICMALVLASCAAATIQHLRRLTLQPIVREPVARATRVLADLFVSRALVYVGFYTLLGYLYFYVASVLPPHFTLDTNTASGVAILLFTAMGGAGATLAAKPADRLDERIVVSIGGALTAASIFALAAAHVLLAVPVFVAAAGVGWGIFLCADWAFACRLLPRGSMATTMAVWNLAVVGPQIIAPLAATAVLSRLGTLRSANGPRDAFVLAGIEIVAGAAWIWRLSKQETGHKF